MDTTSIIDLTPANILEHSLFCIVDQKSPGFKNKHHWFGIRYKEGLRMKILKNPENKPIGFIEYMPADLAWRPVDAPGFMFIHCVYVYPNKNKNKGYGSMFLSECEDDAKSRGMAGMCVMTSQGSWIADRRLFEKYGFRKVGAKGRFELLSKKWDQEAPDPRLIDWTTRQKKYKGWHLLYADQCPWHEKSVLAIKKVAEEYGIRLTIKKITKPEEAKKAPSGFGVFSLLRDGQLLEDHYISETRFRNILKKEMQVGTPPDKLKN